MGKNLILVLRTCKDNLGSSFQKHFHRQTSFSPPIVATVKEETGATATSGASPGVLGKGSKSSSRPRRRKRKQRAQKFLRFPFQTASIFHSRRRRRNWEEAQQKKKRKKSFPSLFSQARDKVRRGINYTE